MPGKIAIVGAGAAGCFCAAVLRHAAPEMAVTLFEAGPKPMAKLAVTGGGRCNLTNDFQGIKSLKEAYPRGERVMQRALKAFSEQDTVRWFETHGVPLVLQDDHCWFPRSQDAMDVVRCLEQALKGSSLRLQHPVQAIEAQDGRYLVDGEPFDFVVVTTGGAPKGLPFLRPLALETVPPVPSLFTFNIPDKSLTALMGLVTEAAVSLPGTAFKAVGPLLITDWGLSGPATLKLSSYAARYLAEHDYKGTVSINWMAQSEAETKVQLQQLAAGNPQKQLSSARLLQARLWQHLMQRAGLRKDIRWAELGSKGLNKLTATLSADTYPLAGKSRFREEFVTAGGVSLENVHLSTLECKQHPGLYFAGEVLDIDAITGGFNLQAAWSTGYVCAHSIVKSL